MEQSLDIWRKELSSPREILAPDTDFNYQTQKPELAEYGVLRIENIVQDWKEIVR